MKFSDKFIRSQLQLIKPVATGASLDLARNVQDKLGRLIGFEHRRDVVISDEDFDGIKAAMVLPRDEIRHGIILYLHGGGYTCGGIEYAKGFASVLAAECGMRCATFEYRLAPEHPYPAAIDDSIIAYEYLLKSGYNPNSIILAGESAGGGLCYALSLKLKQKGIDMPAGIIALSPWCDLTLSGASYETNKESDPTLTKERLEFFSDCYTGVIASGKKGKDKKNLENRKNAENPLVSPIFADLTGLPPSLIFAGGDEILLSDAQTMHEKMISYGVSSKLTIRSGMWHAYHMYNLKSVRLDYKQINDFVKQCLPKENERKLRWMTLDNSGKIYPAAASARWTNVFRLSATLKEQVDTRVLQAALDVTVRRFPSIAVRLRRGTFWYYLEEIAHAPTLQEEKAFPLSRMPFDDIRSCAFRVIAYNKRIAVEFFHALTDGNGGLVFLKTLLAEYISEKYAEKVPTGNGILDRLEPPSEEELEDSLVRHAGKFPQSRKDTDSYRIFGDLEPDGFCHNVAFRIKSDELLQTAHKYGVSVTEFLTAAVIKAGVLLQNKDTRSLRRQKPVKVLVPCNLRTLFGSKTLRNFALYATPGIDPRLGEYTFEEICQLVHNQIKLEITKKNMASRMRTNVKDEESLLLKIAPLFLKNIVMKAVFYMVGEKKSMLTLSNLGVVKLPDEMEKYVDRFDFILSVQSNAPYNLSVITYNGIANLNFIRNIKEPRLEMCLYRILRELGISVKVESNLPKTKA